MEFLEKPVVIKGYPIPPSENKLKMPISRWQKGGGKKVFSMCDSPEYKSFKNLVDIWFIQNRPLFQTTFEKILTWENKGHVLGLLVDLRAHHSTIWTQSGTAKKWDITNYMKATHDTFCERVGFDDSLFFDCRQRKMEISNDKQECLSFLIGPIKPPKEQ